MSQMQKRHAGHGQEKLLLIGIIDVSSLIQNLAGLCWCTTEEAHILKGVKHPDNSGSLQ